MLKISFRNTLCPSRRGTQSTLSFLFPKNDFLHTGTMYLLVMDVFRPPVLPLEPCWVWGAHQGDPELRAPGHRESHQPSCSLAEVEIPQRCFCTAGQIPCCGTGALASRGGTGDPSCAQAVEGTGRRGLKVSQGGHCRWQELFLLMGETWTALFWRFPVPPCQDQCFWKWK